MDEYITQENENIKKNIENNSDSDNNSDNSEILQEEEIIENNSNIDLNSIVKKYVLENKLLGFSLLLFLGGIWFYDIVFSRTIGKVLADIPSFVNEMNFSKILQIIFPYVTAFGLYFLDDIISANVLPKIEIGIVNELVNKILESIKTTKQSINTSELMLKMRSIIDIKHIYAAFTAYILPTFIVFFSLLFYFFKADKMIALIIIIIAVAFFFISYKLEKKCLDISEDHENKYLEFYDEVQDVIINADTIVTNNTIDKEGEKLIEMSNDNYDNYRKSEIVNGEVILGLSLSSLILMLVIDAFVVKLYYKKLISAELMVTLCILSFTFIQYYNRAIAKIKSITAYLSKYSDLVEYFEQFKLKEEKIKKEKNNKITNGNIIFENVQPKYEKKYLPKKININIKGGTQVGIVGKIGAGKSSILKILAGLRDYKGKITIDGLDFDKISYEELVNSIVYVSQHPKLFNNSIKHNLKYGSEYSDEELIRSIEKLGVSDYFNKFDNGLEYSVGKEGGNLSGGQKQIVAVVRAIIHQKKILLLDEPTSSLDPETKNIFIKLIKSIKNKTLIVVTHDKSIYQLFDEIITL